jgi:hypothetical protein
MRVTMLADRRGTEDGYTIHLFQRGKSYDLSTSLAKAFLAVGCAVKEEKKSRVVKRTTSTRTTKKRRTS